MREIPLGLGACGWDDLGMGIARTARLKVHRRSFVVDGRRHNALALRPVGRRTAPRFATNRYHHTWHVLSSVDGAELLEPEPV